MTGLLVSFVPIQILVLWNIIRPTSKCMANPWKTADSGLQNYFSKYKTCSVSMKGSSDVPTVFYNQKVSLEALP